jgi:hypothetical protein
MTFVDISFPSGWRFTTTYRVLADLGDTEFEGRQNFAEWLMFWGVGSLNARSRENGGTKILQKCPKLKVSSSP